MCKWVACIREEIQEFDLKKKYGGPDQKYVQKFHGNQDTKIILICSLYLLND